MTFIKSLLRSEWSKKKDLNKKQLTSGMMIIATDFKDSEASENNVNVWTIKLLPL